MLGDYRLYRSSCKYGLIAHNIKSSSLRLHIPIFTARKQNLGEGNMFTGVCLSTGGYLVPGGAWSWGVPGPRGVPGPLVYLVPGGA